MASAQELLAARARRIAMIRRRVVAAVVASFVFAWGVIAWDGAMRNATTAQVATAPTATPSSPFAADDGSTLTTRQS